MHLYMMFYKFGSNEPPNIRKNENLVIPHPIHFGDQFLDGGYNEDSLN